MLDSCNDFSCVGICYLIKVRMMKDRKYRRGLQHLDIEETNEINDIEEHYEEYTLHDVEEAYDVTEEMEITETTTIFPTESSTSSEPSIYSQLLWNSFLKKIGG